jgi:hypothetical protein
MPHLFYHFPKCPKGFERSNRAEWSAIGMIPIVDRVDGNGVVHQLDNGWQRLCVWPEGQEFVPPAGKEELLEVDDQLRVSWFGDRQPGPDDLDNGNPLRLQTVPLILADGEVWQIPEIREPSGSLLPTDLTRCRRTGQLLNPIKREFQQLWEETEYWFDLKWKSLTGEATTFALERALIFATQVLGLRYRFCDATQSALRVIDSVNVQPIIEVAIGWPALMERIKQITADEAQKKSPGQSAGSVNGSSGLEDSGQTTGPLEASSG